jgi:hypothetical protein
VNCNTKALIGVQFTGKTVKKIYTFNDLASLNQDFKKETFYYNDSKYSTYYHQNDKTPQIRNLTNDGKGIKYSSFMYSVRAELKVEQPTEFKEIEKAPSIPSTIDKLTDISRYITEVKEELSQPFLELMQLPFKDEYQNHPNIKLLDFKALNSDHVQAYKIDKVIPILHFQNEDSANVRYKWNGNKKIDGWYTLSDINSRGAFIEASGKASTLVMLEGLKDGINGNIVVGQNCDILIVDSKTSTIDFKLIPNFTPKKYTTILFIQDKGVTEKQMLKMIQGVAGEKKALSNSIEQGIGIGAVITDHKEVLKFYEKIRFYNAENYTEKITDFTDIMESFNLTNAKLKRTALKLLKDNCSKERFINIYNREEIKLIDSYLDIYMNTSNIEKFMYYTLKKISLGGDIEREFKYYMSRLVEPPKDHSILHLDKSKFLSLKSQEIADFFKTNSHVLIGSPTGTGKSNVVQGIVKKEFLKEDNKAIKSTDEIKQLLKEQGKDFTIESVLKEGLPLFFKNIIFIVPLVDLAVEAGQHPLFTHVEGTNRHGELGANLSQNCIVVTTDTFDSLRTVPLTKDMMAQRIKEAELIVFDEQHYPHSAEGFRGLVTSSYKYLERYKGNVLYLSGTPIFAEASHAHAVVTKLSREFISKIDFYIDPFKDEEETLQSMKDNLEKGSILFYCKSTDEASRVHNVLHDGGYEVVKIISKEYFRNGKEITKEEVAQLKGKIAYVATTKITTGANLDQLIAIYQHGTAFDPFTFVQLTARLRGDGKYYLIKVKNDRAKSDNIQNKAIFLCNMAKKFNIHKMSDIWENKDFKKFIKKNVELPYGKNNLKGFLNIYRDSIQLIQSEILGASPKDGSDFEFLNSPKKHHNDEPILKVHGLDENQIKKKFLGADSVNYRKFFERKIIDSITQNRKVEILNDVFELSFDYVIRNDLTWSEAVGKKFITEDDEAKRVAKKEEKETIQDEFEAKLNEKFKDIISVDLLKKHMNGTALNKLLNDEKLDRERDKKKLKETKAKAVINNTGAKPIITALHCYLINPKQIIKIIIIDIKENGHTTLKRVSELIEQKDYLSTKKSKDIFVTFLRDFFIDETFDKEDLEYNPNQKKINGKLIRDTITIPKAKLKEFNKIKDIEKREEAKKIELERIMKKQLEKYGADIELIID